jgi:hypothetical protein
MSPWNNSLRLGAPRTRYASKSQRLEKLRDEPKWTQLERAHRHEMPSSLIPPKLQVSISALTILLTRVQRVASRSCAGVSTVLVPTAA